ncbi:hypothetical protein TNCT_534171 [Trichonephila clavata]|uniref:Uncharacterized protein n=1 Tax=Trichonephila clavata TaxID=2740835 RepID=A0A8X6GWE6_TRICU|nr:hypothetical protein TNCT_534171 [Trichonephila clavata]
MKKSGASRRASHGMPLSSSKIPLSMPSESGMLVMMMMGSWSPTAHAHFSGHPRETRIKCCPHVRPRKRISEKLYLDFSIKIVELMAASTDSLL